MGAVACGAMESAYQYHAARALLDWQIELGATEAICDAPVDRYGLPESLPKGFRLTSVGHGGSDDQRYEHLLFSDGLSSFSIYIEFERSAGISERIESRGAMHIYTGSIDGNLVTVVGEVPAPTVRLIGRHLRRLQVPILRHLD